VTKIHSALKFRQSPWMKEYIEKNIRKRKIAKANRDEFGSLELLRTEEDKKIRRLASSLLYVGFKAFEGSITA
ncbi:26948_t:CDS:2, partial [Racocetra persica]